MADICALMPTLHLNVFTFCKQLQKFSVILRSQKLVKPGKHLAVFEPCNSWIPFFNRKLVYLSIKCRDCLLLLTTFQYFSPFQKMWLPALFLKDQVHVSVSINHILIFFSFPENWKKGIAHSVQGPGAGISIYQGDPSNSNGKKKSSLRAWCGHFGLGIIPNLSMTFPFFGPKSDHCLVYVYT